MLRNTVSVCVAFSALGVAACSSVTASPIGEDRGSCEVTRVAVYTEGSAHYGCWLDAERMPESAAAEALEGPLADGVISMAQAQAIADQVIFTSEGEICLDAIRHEVEPALAGVDALVAAGAISEENRCSTGGDSHGA